jgi:preprotein translocase subunit SecD
MPPAPRRRSVLPVGGVALLLALGLSACGGEDQPDAPASGAGLQVRPVLTSPPPDGAASPVCEASEDPELPGNPSADEEAALCDPDGTAYRLGPAVVGQEGVEAADLYRTSEAWRIEVTLDPESTEAVAALAEDASSSDSQVAIVVDGLVLSAPTVAGTIGGTLQLVGTWTGAQAEDYTARIAP